MSDKEKIEFLLAALGQIAKAEGRFSMDRLEHAQFTIEDMVDIAEKAQRWDDWNDQ